MYFFKRFYFLFFAGNPAVTNDNYI